MDRTSEAIQYLNRSVSEIEQQDLISFEGFLKVLTTRPPKVLRNVFQVFHDMIKTYMGEGIEEYPNDPESIHFVCYNCNKLFVNGVDHPFFADRLFANRLVNLVEAWKRGTQQNKIYIFKGPPGSGKSTFLNNLLMRFEEYANSDDGSRYEIVWRLNRKMLGGVMGTENIPLIENALGLLDETTRDHDHIIEVPGISHLDDDYFEIPCTSHDNPILMIPKIYRRQFFETLIEDKEFLSKLLSEKEYDWVFRDNPCTICTSLFHALLQKLKNPQNIFDMLYARPYQFTRRLGEGISVFNPGDKPMMESILTNEMLQKRINGLLKDSNRVKYLFSQYAKTNNGIYALMDIKSNNTDRLIELHNIIVT